MSPVKSPFSAAETSRYSRHLLLPEIGLQGQQKLKAARVLVVGCGGLGCPVLQYLAAAGVGTLGLLDFDVVDDSNLQRQVLYATADVGRPTSAVAKSTWRCRLESSTVSKTSRPSVPTPAAARY